MAVREGKRRGEDAVRLPSIWDVEDDEGAEPDEGEGSVRSDGVLRPRPVGAVPFPFERLEGAARALAALDERLAERPTRRRWFAAMRRKTAAEHGRLCGFPVEVEDACLIEWDPLAPGQSRHNGLWVVARGLRASRLVQRRTRARPPDEEQVAELGRAALGRWGADAVRGAADACERWRRLAEGDRRGLLVFCEALAAVGSWAGLDVEERAVLMGVLSPWLARVFVPTRWCCGYVMRDVSRSPALWEREAQTGGEEWVALVLEAVEGCASDGHNVLRQLELRYGMALQGSPARRASHSYARAVDYLFECPMVDVQSVMRGLGLSRAGAQRLVGELVAAGLLSGSSRGRSRRYFAWKIAAEGMR